MFVSEREPPEFKEGTDTGLMDQVYSVVVLFELGGGPCQHVFASV